MSTNLDGKEKINKKKTRNLKIPVLKSILYIHYKSSLKFYNKNYLYFLFIMAYCKLEQRLCK
jgi:hypothetical protein